MKKHQVIIDPPSYRGWDLSYEEGCYDTPFMASHPEKKGVIHACSLKRAMERVDCRERGMLRLKDPIPVSVDTVHHPGRGWEDAEVFAHDDQQIYLKYEDGEVGALFKQNFKNGHDKARVRNKEFEELRDRVLEAQARKNELAYEINSLTKKFVKLTLEAVESAPAVREERGEE